jgi:hypothetical protein
MNQVDKLWVALGKAIRAGASTKQVDGIANRLNRLRRDGM